MRMEDDSPVSPLAARAFFEAKAEHRRALLGSRLDKARSEAATIIEMIARDYRPLHIWQWGSLIKPERFSEISDIDIAVEGFNGGEAAWSELLGKAEAMSEFPLDIVRLERIEGLHAASIRESGRIAYARA